MLFQLWRRRRFIRFFLTFHSIFAVIGFSLSPLLRISVIYIPSGRKCSPTSHQSNALLVLSVHTHTSRGGEEGRYREKEKTSNGNQLGKVFMEICGWTFLYFSFIPVFLSPSLSLYLPRSRHSYFLFKTHEASNQSDLYSLLSSLCAVELFVVCVYCIVLSAGMCFTFGISSCQQFKTFQFGFFLGAFSVVGLSVCIVCSPKFYDFVFITVVVVVFIFWRK